MYDETKQLQRAEKLNKKLIDLYLKDMLPGGSLYDDKFPYGGREKLFYCTALFNTSDEYAQDVETILSTPGQYEGFCTFVPFMTMVDLLQCKQNLTDNIIKKFENYIQENLHACKDDMWDFVGVNDNTPAMIMVLLLLAGTYFDRPDCREVGLKRLAKLKAMLNRRVYLSEFNSPTYDAVTFYALASLANYDADDEVRQTALWCEQRVWKVFMNHYHRDVCTPAGPYSRAYLPDSLGVAHQSRFLLYSVMGDDFPINPWNTIFSEEGDDPDALRSHHTITGETLALQVSQGWLGNMIYHCPKEYIKDALNRSYPFYSKGDAEVSSSFDNHSILQSAAGYHGDGDVNLSPLLEQDDVYEYPSSDSIIYSYLNDGYSMGTCTRPFHNGMPTDSYHLLYTKGSPARDRKDVGSVFARYEFNAKGIQSFPSENHGIHCMGRKFAFQHENTAMVLYRPKSYSEPLNSLQLSLLFYNRYNMIDEIWMGNTKLALNELPVMKAGNIPVYVRSGDVYMAFMPLDSKGQFGESAVKIVQRHGFVFVSFVNYEGEEKIFHRKGLCILPNGFISEVRNKKEAGDFDSFKNQYTFDDITDRMFTNAHTRFTYHREVVYRRPGLEMSCELSPLTEGIKHMAVNGRLY